MDAYNVGSRPKKRKRLGVDNFENDDEAHGEAKPSHLDSCMNEVDGKILLKCPNHAASRPELVNLNNFGVFRDTL